jgi:hypothetical protein
LEIWRFKKHIALSEKSHLYLSFNIIVFGQQRAEKFHNPTYHCVFSGQKITLDWYPITRDCFIYGITVIILSLVLVDGFVFWWEAMIMVICYAFYISLMFFNVKIERWAESVVKTVKKRVYPSATVINGNGAVADNNSTNSPQ